MPPCTCTDVSHTLRAARAQYALAAAAAASASGASRESTAHARVQGDAARSLHGHVGVDQQVLEGLEGSDGRVILAPGGRVRPGQLEGTAHDADEIGACEGQAERHPAGQIVTAQGAGRLEHVEHAAVVDDGITAGEVELGGPRPQRDAAETPAGGGFFAQQDEGHLSRGDVQRHPRRCLAVQRARRCRQGSVEKHGFGSVGGPGTGPSAQIGGHGRAEEGHVGQAAAELLGHDGDLHPRGERPVALGALSQFVPARGLHGIGEPARALAVVESGHRARREPGDELGGGGTQRKLLGGQTDVHHASAGAPSRTGPH